MAAHTLTPAGSFMPTLEPIPTTVAKAEPQKAERQKAEQRRMDRLPSEVLGWGDRLDLDALELLGALHRSYKAERVPVPFSASVYASRIKSSPDAVRARLASLQSAGAVAEIPRIQAPSLYRPIAKSTATKAEGALTGLAAMGIRPRA